MSSVQKKNYQDIYQQCQKISSKSNVKDKVEQSSSNLQDQETKKKPLSQLFRKNINLSQHLNQQITPQKNQQFSFNQSSQQLSVRIQPNISIQNSLQSQFSPTIKKEKIQDKLEKNSIISNTPFCSSDSNRECQFQKVNFSLKDGQQDSIIHKIQMAGNKLQVQEQIKKLKISKRTADKKITNQTSNSQHPFQSLKNMSTKSKEQQISFIYFLQLKDNNGDMKDKSRFSVNKLQSILIPSSIETKKNQFTFEQVIGRGGFGKVWKVQFKKDKKTYALKVMSKSLVISKKSVSSVMNEKTLLSELKNEFIINMFYAFQDKENLYLVMDYKSGGDLRYQIGVHRTFSEEQTKFFICCIFLGLEYLHNNKIIHRDIKPENIVLDEFGYARITDLGIARKWKADNENDTSGTPGYMAPEVMCRQSHTYAVDYFALGVIAYEFMLGRRPYLGRSRKEIRDQILSRRVQIKKNEIPEGWSMEAADFINKLIERKPNNRLGINGPQDVKNHIWIRNISWDLLQKRKLVSPFIPRDKDNFDTRQLISSEDEQNQEFIRQNNLLLRRNSVQNLFNGYQNDKVNKLESNQTSNSLGQSTNNTTKGSSSALSYFLKSSKKFQEINQQIKKIEINI